MEFLIIKRLIDDKLLDFDKLLKNNYRDIGLNEMEVFFLMELNSIREKGITSITPNSLTQQLSLNEVEAANLLDSMMQREYLSFKVIENKEGKTTESFSLDQTILKIIDLYKKNIEKDIVKTNSEPKVDEGEISEILETQLQRQLKPLEVEIIIKWVKEYKYDLKSIKNAIIDSVKAGKTSIAYIDGILLKEQKKQKDIVSQSKRKKSKILKEFLES